MRLTVTVVDPDGASGPADMEVVAAPGVTLGAVREELLRGVGRSDGQLWCGAQELATPALLGEPPVLDGAVLTVDRPDVHDPPALLELHVRSGPDSGAVHRLGRGEHTIGRAVEARVRLADRDVSRLHAVVRVAVSGLGATTVHDLSSTNGTRVDGDLVPAAGGALLPGQVLTVGSTGLSLVVPQTLPVSCRPDGDGHLELNRPPRHVPSAVRVRVTMPAEPVAADSTHLPVVALALPLVAGLVLVAVTRSPTYLLFVLLAPLMMLGTHLNDRLAGKRSRRTSQAEHAASTARCRATVERALVDESAARHLAHPDAATLLLAATGPRPALWQRRADDDDFLEVRLGLGNVTSRIEVRTPGAAGSPEAVEHPRLRTVPVTVCLRTAGVLGLAGSRDRVLPLARAVVAQLAGWHSPRALRLVVLGTATDSDWEWTRWLPHLRPTGDDSRVLVANDQIQLRARVDELVAVLDARTAQVSRQVAASWRGPVTVVVLDGAGSLRRLPGIARLLAEGPAVGLHVLCCEHDVVSLPVECRATAEVGGAGGSRLRVLTAGATTGGTTGGTTYDDVVADAVSDRWAHRFARALAPLRDATPEDVAGTLPAHTRLLDLLAIDATDPSALATAWRTGPRSTRVLIGVGTDGEPDGIDLAADGPHVLVAGTTGSGKSELLQTLVAGLALANRPDEMSFVLVDYKGGAAFTDCARLPHTVGMVTDLDSHLTERALRSLGAELRRRERLLAATGCKDLDDYLAVPASRRATLPRLVLVVDEFATLAEELPDFLGGLVGIAQRGRSLGVHLVLATQRPGGVVSADIRANTGLRIALRVADAAESSDVLGCGDAAAIDPSTPGRAVLRVAGGAPRLMQTARVGGTADEPSATTRVRPVPWAIAGAPAPVPTKETTSGPTDLRQLVDAAVAAARQLAVAPTASPWLPPLPLSVTTADLDPPETGAAVGLLDLPEEQRRASACFQLIGGDHLLVVGGARSGRSTLLRTIAGELAGRHDVADVHLYVLDGGGDALSVLAALPHCGAVVSRDDTARGDRLLTRLTAELERRQGLLSGRGLGSHEEQRRGAAPEGRLPWLVVLADGWEGLQSAYEDVDHGRPLDALARLVREGAAVGIRVVLTGGRAVLTHRIGAGFHDRLVLRLSDPGDYGLAGIPGRRVPNQMPPGRALLGADGVECQLALLPGDRTGSGQVAALDEVAVQARRRATDASVPANMLPFRMEPMPVRVEVEEVEVDAKAVATGPGWVLVGVGGDRLDPVGVDLGADGPAFVVAGPAGSGRSTTLATMGRWLRQQGRQVVIVSHRRSPLRTLHDETGVLGCLGPGDADRLETLLSDHPDVVVLCDDAETLHDTPVERPLVGLLRADTDGSASLVLAGSAAEMAGCFRGLTVEARRGRTGLLLGPVALGDGDLLGVRLPRSPAGSAGTAGPGRGTLVVRGAATPVQVARTAL